MIVNKVVVHLTVVVKQLNSDSVIINERASNERIWESLDRHRVIINIKCAIYIEIFFLALLQGSGYLGENSQPEFSIVYEYDCILLASRILLYLLRADVTLRSSANHFFKSFVV